MNAKRRIENNSLANGLWFFELTFNSHTQQHILDLLNYIKQNMVNAQIVIKNILIWLAIIAVDIFVFIALGLLLMNYDDFYESSKGEYWSLASMNSTEKVIYICYNAWIVLNIIGLLYIGQRIYRKTRKTKKYAS